MSRQYQVVFVGGCHGVGKTTFCRHLVTRVLAEHVSASALIGSVRASRESLTKQVANVEQNQDDLVLALEQYQSRAPLLVLDGHFCLVTHGGAVEAIPLSTFRELAPRAIIVLEAEVQLIQERMRSRGGVVLPAATLLDLQQKETKHARHVAEVLEVPLLKLKEPFQQSEAEAFLATACAER